MNLFVWIRVNLCRFVICIYDISPTTGPRSCADFFWILTKPMRQALCQSIKPQINHRRRVKRQNWLRINPPTIAMPSGRRSSTRAPPQRQRHAAQKGRQRRHHDRAESQQTRLKDRFLGRLAMLALVLQRKVDHHDRVLLHDADQQNDADQRDHAEIIRGSHQCQQARPRPPTAASKESSAGGYSFHTARRARYRPSPAPRGSAAIRFVSDDSNARAVP